MNARHDNGSEHAALRRALGRERRLQLAARLALGPATTAELAETVGSITTRELLSLLRTMRHHHLAEREGDTWRVADASAAGAPVRRKQSRRDKAFGEPDVRCVPAVQIGLQRDALVAALFGAARSLASTTLDSYA